MLKKSDYRIYVDTNVLVNYFTGQAVDVACLQYLFGHKRKENLFTSTLALVQIASQLQKKKADRKAFDKNKVIEYLYFLLKKFTILDLTQKDVMNSLPLKNKDIEDNVHYIISQKWKCTRIITRDIGDYAQFVGIEALSPKNITLIKKIG